MTVAAFVGQALIGWLLADLLSGIVHWWEDRVGEMAWPVIGQAVIAPNRLHHVDVLYFAQSSLLARNLAAWLVVAATSAVWFWLAGPSVVWAFATLGGALAAEVHRMAHLPVSVGPVGRVLQEVGLIQSPRHHAGHHKAPSDRRYCVLTDWLNPALDALGVWRRLESAMDRVGLSPNRGAR